MLILLLVWDRNRQARLIFLSFGREDLEKFLCYFQFITGTIDDKDKTVQRLLSEGYLYG